MKTKIIEATNPGSNGSAGFNWGKFLVLQLDEVEWSVKSVIPCGDPEIQAVQDKYPLLRHIGMSRATVFVIDLQTREGAGFVPGGCAAIDLNQKCVWVCPMYEPFLQWLYGQDLKDVTKLPSLAVLTDAPGDFRGYRRTGEECFADGGGI